MNPKMWKELKEWATETARMQYIDASDPLQKMTELERRDLPQRVAEILVLASNKMGSNVWAMSRTDILDTIARVLKSNDTTEIEEWRE